MKYDPLQMLNAQLKKSTQRDLAKRIGISPQYLSEILNRGKPPPEKVLDYLGLEEIIVYRPKRPQS